MDKNNELFFKKKTKTKTKTKKKEKETRKVRVFQTENRKTIRKLQRVLKSIEETNIPSEICLNA